MNNRQYADRKGLSDGSDRSDLSGRGDQSAKRAGRQGALRPHGGYRKLRSFQVAEIIYDSTVAFCEQFVNKRSRTHDQMVQAARSGRQNIAEGSRARHAPGRMRVPYSGAVPRSRTAEGLATATLSQRRND